MEVVRGAENGAWLGGRGRRALSNEGAALVAYGNGTVVLS